MFLRRHRAAVFGAPALALTLALGYGHGQQPAAATERGTAPKVRVAAPKSPMAAKVDPGFLSFAVDIVAVTGGIAADPDSNENVEFPPYDFNRPKLMRLTQALVGGRPGYLRISGTDSDKTYYDLSGARDPEPPDGFRRVLTRPQWDDANRFAERLDLLVDFGINAGPGPRDEAYRWLPENARALLEYTAVKGYPLGAVEFGNEPNVFFGTTTSQATYSYTAADYARDIEEFDALRRELAPQAILVGPGPLLTPRDPNGERPITVRDVVIDQGGADPGESAEVGFPLGPEARDTMPLVPGIYGAVNYHFYPFFSNRCVFRPKAPADPLDPAWLDQHLANFEYMNGLREAHNPGAPMWLGETGSAACGGEVGYSDRHAATFYWLNQLGQLGQRGLSVIVRQALEGGTYGLLTQGELEPNPDYWASLLWRRLMGPRQLDIRARSLPKTVRLYGACTPGRNGRVTTLALNLSRDDTSRVRFTGRGSRKLRVFRVTAPELSSREVRLNGQLLSAPAGRVPDLRPRRARGRAVKLPPASYAFVVQPAGAGTCARG